MRERLQKWVDTDLTLGNAQRVRLRVQHTIVLLYLLIGSIYTTLFAWLGLSLTAILIALNAMLACIALLGLSRRGKIKQGGSIISVLVFVAIFFAVITRGGMTSNAAAWLVLPPILGSFMVAPRHGAAMGGATLLGFVSMWSVEFAGVAMPVGLPEAALSWMPLLDYPAITVTIGALLWLQAGMWESLLHDLDQTNTAMESEIQTRLQAEQVANNAARARSTFLATMSHEIRTPLNGVIGLTEVLLRSELDPEQQELARTIQGSGALLSTLLDDILDYSKIDSGHMELEQLPVDVSKLLHETRQLWVGPARERGNRLEATTQPGMPRWLALDPTRLQQILNNLLSNAIKFTEAGQIRLTAAAVEDQLVLTVSDTGVGISPQAQEKIFALFEQEDGSTTRRFGGTGLGLAISRKLARLMGGELVVSSILGEGSTFTLTIPLTQTAAPSQPPPGANVSLSLSGMRILVAEDNPVNQLVVRRLLEQHNVLVQIVEDGEAVLEAWKAEAPDLILMDCQMPVCDGYEATRRLRAAGASLPIIALTADSMPGDRARCLAAGMNEHLSKPIQIDALLYLLLKLSVSTRMV